ncbi:MAG: hypothetical protein WCV93_01810 [Candidatus Shapirobacteria bacterium]
MKNEDVETSRHHLLPKEFVGMRVSLTGLGVISVRREDVFCERNVMKLDGRLHALTHYWWVVMLEDRRLAEKQRMGMGGLTGGMTRSEWQWFQRATAKLDKNPTETIDPFWKRWTLNELLV